MDSSPVLNSFFEKLNHKKVFIRTIGPQDGTPAILVHGIGVSGRYMIRLARKLAGLSYRVYVPDLPGFGRSEQPVRKLDVANYADFLHHLLDRLGIGSAILVGNSFGCQVIVEFAIHNAKRVQKLILIGPIVDSAHRSATAQISRLILDAFLEPFSLLPIAIFDYLQAGPALLITTLKFLLAYEIENALPGIEVPALVIVGERDPVSSIAWARQVVALLPDAELLVVNKAGHAVNYSAPGRVAEAISRSKIMAPLG